MKFVELCNTYHKSTLSGEKKKGVNSKSIEKQKDTNFIDFV